MNNSSSWDWLLDWKERSSGPYNYEVAMILLKIPDVYPQDYAAFDNSRVGSTNDDSSVLGSDDNSVALGSDDNSCVGFDDVFPIS